MGKKKQWLDGEYKEMAAVGFRNNVQCYDKYTAKMDYGTGELYSSAEILLLRQIETYPGISVTQLAELTNRTKSAISQLVKRLLNMAVIQRTYDADNAKVGKFFLTEKGRNLVIVSYEKSQKLMQAQVELLRERFSDAEIETFFDVLEATVSISDEMVEKFGVKLEGQKSK